MLSFGRSDWRSPDLLLSLHHNIPDVVNGHHNIPDVVNFALWYNLKNHKMAENKIERLETLMGELSDYDKMKELKELFKAVIPQGTVILLTNEDYEDCNVPDPYDTPIYNHHIDHMEFVQGIAFRMEERGLFCVEVINEDEIYDSWWRIDINNENLNLLKLLLYQFKSGHYIQDGEDPNWVEPESI